MLASALVEVAERFRRRVDEALDGVEDPRERLLAVADACNPDTPDAVANQVVWTEFWVRAARNEQLRDLHAGLYDDWRRRIASIVRAGVARGAFRQVDAYEWACQFAALLDGLALHVILHPGALGRRGDGVELPRLRGRDARRRRGSAGERDRLARVRRAVDRLDRARLPDRLVAPDQHLAVRLDGARHVGDLEGVESPASRAAPRRRRSPRPGGSATGRGRARSPCSPTTSMPWVLAVERGREGGGEAARELQHAGHAQVGVAGPGGSWRAKTRDGSSSAIMREPLMQ